MARELLAQADAEDPRPAELISVKLVTGDTWRLTIDGQEFPFLVSAVSTEITAHGLPSLTVKIEAECVLFEHRLGRTVARRVDA